MGVEVGPAGRQDTAAAAGVVAAALEDDAVIRAMVPGDHDRLARLTSVHASVLRMTWASGGAVDVARDAADGPVVGVAVWEAPGARVALRAALRELPRLVRAVGPVHLPAGVHALRVFDRHRPRYPHWFLADLAAAPSARGKGVGSALLAHRLAAVDAAGLPAYLEATTEGSRRLYERFGFRAVETIRLRGGVTATAMVRPAGASAEG